jgi:hypothetical protein
MVVLAAGQCRFEPRDPVPQVDPLHEPASVEPFEGAVHAGEADVNARGAHRIVDLLRGETAVLSAEELDDRTPCSSAPTARRSEVLDGGRCPVSGHGRTIMIPVLKKW